MMALIEMRFVSHQPRPVDDPVQPQSDEDELENINRTQDLQLRGKQGTSVSYTNIGHLCLKINT